MKTNPNSLPTMIDDHLRLRFAEPKDRRAVAQFQQRIHQADSEYASHNFVGKCVDSLLSGNHPTFEAGDFTLVEDVETGNIVSSMCLISQTWTFGGIPFGVGQPEFVATEPEYRRRGLVRRQFDALHALSASRGEQMQVITGIPWFYRQFGYEMALDMAAGRRIPFTNLPDAPAENPYRLRIAQTDDIPFMRELYEHSASRQPFAIVWSPEDWTYDVKTGRDKGTTGTTYLIIETLAGERVGFLRQKAWQESPWVLIGSLQLVAGISYLNVMPNLLNALWDDIRSPGRCEPIPAADLKGFWFILGREHPAYAAFHRKMWHEERPYGWYIRIPDLVGFLRHIRPALERHLLDTPAEGYTGELLVNLYKTGIRFQFERGALTEIEEKRLDWGHARFPDLTFLQLLCGRKRCDELARAHVDCDVEQDALVLLDAMFPPFTGDLMCLV